MTTLIIRYVRYFASKEGLQFNFVTLPHFIVECLAYMSYFVTWISNGRLSPYLKKLNQLRPIAIELALAPIVFSDAKGKEILGYEPLYSIEQGMLKAVHQFFRHNPINTKSPLTSSPTSKFS